MARFIVLVSVLLGSLVSQTRALQIADPLGKPALGPLTVRLDVRADGLGGILDPVNTDGSTGVTFPTDAAALPGGDGRVLVLTLDAKIHLLGADGSLTLFHDFLDPSMTAIRPRGNEFGPTGIVAHPRFDTNGKLYVIETEIPGAGDADFGPNFGGPIGDHQDVLYEYTMDDPTADSLVPGAFTKREVMRITQPRGSHSTNDLAFKADETLLISIGDGGNSGGLDTPPQLDAGNPASVFGKILRIDPVSGTPGGDGYGVPSDNPLIDDPDAAPEVYSLGHRNPFRVDVDPLTGEVWVGEVGQRTIEEINRIAPGAHHGWAFKEGSFLFGLAAGDADSDGDIDNADVAPDQDLDGNGTGDFADANGLTDPVFEYGRETGRSVTGGLVYRGDTLARLDGLYLFADATTQGLYYGPADAAPIAGQRGSFWRFRVDPVGTPAPQAVLGMARDGRGGVLILSAAGEVLEIASVRCTADLAGAPDGGPDGLLDADDFFAYLNLFASGDPGADLAGAPDGGPDGTLDANDFFEYLSLFADGCP